MKNLQGLSFLFLFTDDANAGKEEVDEEKVEGGEDGEEEEEEDEEEEEAGKDEGVDPRLSLQFSESLPLHIFPVWAAHDWKETERNFDIKY